MQWGFDADLALSIVGCEIVVFSSNTAPCLNFARICVKSNDFGTDEGNYFSSLGGEFFKLPLQAVQRNMSLYRGSFMPLSCEQDHMSSSGVSFLGGHKINEINPTWLLANWWDEPGGALLCIMIVEQHLPCWTVPTC